MRNVFFLVGVLLTTTTLGAHEMTPTYPTFAPSYVGGLASTELTVFNARKDVEFYQVGVFDRDWKPIPFATPDKLLHIPYTERTTFDVFVRDEDVRKAVYVCTLSKLRSDVPSNAIISSKICSRTDGNVR
jgi:hypothetical protein